MPRRLAAIALLAATALAAPAQDLHIDHHHTRHLHKQGEKHPVSREPDRFWTSRTSPVQLPLPSEEDAFFFVVYGDRTGGPADGVSVLKDAVRDTNLLEPDFVITVGDLIQGYNEEPEWMSQMSEFKSVMDELLCPWFPVAGNHGVYWRGPEGEKPEGEHDKNYEMHFGPLWYAFEHKNCMFIALYSDEGNPDTGEKNFRKAECQRMSDEQFTWLRSMLEKGRDADHIFLFLHHPRWLGGQYGDDWDKVHRALVDAGNVSAVFAGHIHRMRFDPKDGIDYVTLATVGGHQNATVPEAGWMHHFNIVTVRDNQVAHAAIPVGEVMDVREITGELADDAARLAAIKPAFGAPISLGMDGGCDAELAVSVTNPAPRPVEATILPDTADSRWIFWPDHDHAVLAAGETRTFKFRAERQGDALDASFRPAEIVIDMDMLAPGHRYSIPTIRAEYPLDLDLRTLSTGSPDRALELAGEAYASVPSAAIEIPEGPLTLECWFNADAFEGRTGLITKTEGSEFGLFVSDGKPHFAVHLDGAYRVAEIKQSVLEAGRWHHIAGVYDGSEVRLYLDGALADANPASGVRKTNALPLVIGADVTNQGGAMSHFQGMIDEVRLSATARYAGSTFTPPRRHLPDQHTLLLLHMDDAIGRWLPDQAESHATATLNGPARLVTYE